MPAFFKATPFPEVTEAFCRVPSPKFSQAPLYSLLVHLCRFAVRFFIENFFLEKVKKKQSYHYLLFFFPFRHFLHILTYPLKKAFAVFLGTVFSRRSLTSRRNLWTFGDNVFHCLSLLISVFSLLIFPKIFPNFFQLKYKTFRYHFLQFVASVKILPPLHFKRKKIRHMRCYAFRTSWLLPSLL